MRVNRWDLQQAKRKAGVLRMRCFLNLTCSVWKGGHPNPHYHLNFSQIWKISSKMSSEIWAGYCRSLECSTLLYIFTYIYSQSKSLTEINQKMPILSLVSILDLGMNSTYLILSVLYFKMLCCFILLCLFLPSFSLPDTVSWVHIISFLPQSPCQF